jgi:hypothetical protein
VTLQDARELRDALDVYVICYDAFCDQDGPITGDQVARLRAMEADIEDTIRKLADRG